MEEHITENFEETRQLGESFASTLKGGEILCMEGDLGAGKTTFTQGLLRGLGAEGPYTSPTFVVMKEYKTPKRNIYHIDAYRVRADDILALGWEEIISDKNNIVIVEWPERIRDILPENCLWLKFEWIDENKRKITLEK